MPFVIIRGPVVKAWKTLPPTADHAIIAQYKRLVEGTDTPRLYLPLDSSAPPNTSYLSSRATYYRHVIRNGRRFTPQPLNTQARATNSSLIRACINNEWMYGEIISIFEHAQAGYEPILFTEIFWFHTLTQVPTASNVWAKLYVRSIDYSVQSLILLSALN